MADAQGWLRARLVSVMMVSKMRRYEELHRLKWRLRMGMHLRPCSIFSKMARHPRWPYRGALQRRRSMLWPL